MPDVFTKSKRSEVMSKIRSRGNRGTELVMVALWEHELAKKNAGRLLKRIRKGMELAADY